MRLISTTSTVRNQSPCSSLTLHQ